MGRPRHVE